DTNNDGTMDGYYPDVLSVGDYYVFGGSIEERSYNVSPANYRYGFNGKENDNEVKGTGNQVDFGARGYDSRLGRWLSMDVKTAKFPMLTPYSFVANSPLIAVDPDGKDIFVVVQNSKTGKAEIVKADVTYILQVMNSTKAGHEMLAAYSDNPKKDLYITVGKTNAEGVLGQHTNGTMFKDKEGNITIKTPVKVDENGVNIYDYDPSKHRDPNFEGVEIYNPDRENHFVTLSEEAFDGGNLGLKQAGARLGAKALGHEVGSHADGDPNDAEYQQHDKWGQGVLTITRIRGNNIDFTTYSNGDGKAKEYNEQIDKVKVTKKEGVVVTPIKNRGNASASKVIIK
ncbi:MAG: RHS repeat-associated core domain-containing protein, partial [Sediminibacterium sp.]|nr:RHS repeat-associated core domain-containing protein [Sediminibacterium sp.]